ncbi:MAG: hypoxanthine phosphoribosyltransferase [Acidobacteria bacterium]|nr:hypoxanthine phosphoribosyltransferase [Acidobacteriota bacterium]
MIEDLEKILFTEEEIHRRIKEVAGEISSDYRGRDLVLVAVLKGAVFFMTHLAQALSIPVRIDFLGIESFSPGRALPGVVRISKDLDIAIQGMDVLIIEDIVDMGLTLRYLLNMLQERHPHSTAVCTFVNKATRRLVDIPVKYSCFEIPDRFVVGFGLDYGQLYRNLTCLGILKKEIYQS